MGNYTTIQICDDSNVRTIKLNRPERRNALNSTMIAEMTTALEHAADGPCGAIILTGAGKCFCAGLDLEELQKMESRTIEEHHADAEQFAKLMRLLYDFPKPTIAAVNGAAIAGGTGLATVCDFTYAAQDATFGYTEVKIGFVPAIVSSFLLRQVGEKQARDLLLSGRIFDAKEALLSYEDHRPPADTSARGLQSRIMPAEKQPRVDALDEGSTERTCPRRAGPRTRRVSALECKGEAERRLPRGHSRLFGKAAAGVALAP